MPWRKERLPTPIFWPGEFHGLYSPRGCKELDMTEQLSLHFTSQTNLALGSYKSHVALTALPRECSVNADICVYCACGCVHSHSVMYNSCDPMVCNLLGSSVHGILLVRTLEWVDISSSRGSWPRDWTCISWTGNWILYHWDIWEAQYWHIFLLNLVIFFFFCISVKLVWTLFRRFQRDKG